MSHVDGGWRCAATHHGPEGEKLPQCVICGTCGHHVRPNEMSGACEGKKPKGCKNPG